MFEVYFTVENERNEKPEAIFETFREAMAYALAEEEKYSEDTCFRIYDVKNNQWY